MPKVSQKLVMCMGNSGYDASLECGKIYVVTPDLSAERLGEIRITDESGEGYLYPRALFRLVKNKTAMAIAGRLHRKSRKAAAIEDLSR